MTIRFIRGRGSSEDLVFDPPCIKRVDQLTYLMPVIKPVMPSFLHPKLAVGPIL